MFNDMVTFASYNAQHKGVAIFTLLEKKRAAGNHSGCMAPSNMVTSGREYGLVEYESWKLVSFGHTELWRPCGGGSITLSWLRQGQYGYYGITYPRCGTTRHSEMGIHHQSASIAIIGDLIEKTY